MSKGELSLPGDGWVLRSIFVNFAIKILCLNFQEESGSPDSSLDPHMRSLTVLFESLHFKNHFSPQVSCVGNEGALLPHPDCTKFYQCVNGIPMEKSCPGGLHFSVTISTCDWPSNAGCQ